ncbi:MAG: bifunctional hydroxymethylpyrimidine kinase/phosphomethylpyrimidine kinase [Legionellales bacterium RIFCSPHIGHO2_12_FULL_37_14]|nr:MAG: bifunctional hydroxymethylpyrimidine kinase/phosphomethylpyrimidine kinase [Legionellales bacterium RIFCSPHIGHO2_12_FULL_37_14]
MLKRNRPVVLTIAGTDPTGGAGIQADIKAISANGCYAASVITALVAQNTCGVQAIHPIPATFVTQQLESVFSDLTINAIKIGMLYDATIIQAVAQELKKNPTDHVVLDPVMFAKSANPLLKQDAISLLKQYLFQHAILITPNLSEAEVLIEASIDTQEAMANAAMQIGDQYGCQVLIKGGHLKDAPAIDVLFDPEHGTTCWFEEERILTRNTHGTGCSLSSAIAAKLAKGLVMKDAIQQAKKYLTHSIIAGKDQSLGQGAGPVDHFYFIPYPA